jgi:hypothetical protein
MKQITGRGNIAGLISSNVLISPNLTYAKSRFLAKIIPVPISLKVPNIGECAKMAEFFGQKTLGDIAPPCIILFIKYHNFSYISCSERVNSNPERIFSDE